MSHSPASESTTASAAKICERFPISPEARVLLREGMSPQEYLDTLIDEGELVDAVQFLAHTLPKRQAVWWACRAADATGLTGPADAALRAADAWVAEPTEVRRVAAQ